MDRGAWQYSPWGCKESDTTEHTRARAHAYTHTHTFTYEVGTVTTLTLQSAKLRPRELSNLSKVTKLVEGRAGR